MKKLILFFTLLFLAGCSQTTDYRDTQFHIHTDFKVYLEDQFINFSQEKYMSADSPLHNYIHLHDMNGDVIHFHKEGMTLFDFFESLNMSFNQTCFVDDSGVEYCSNEDKQLRLFVNNDEIINFSDYIAEDLDQILIIYSNLTLEEINEVSTNVTDISCIQSERCPERGEPFDESSCTGSSCVYVFEE